MKPALPTMVRPPGMQMTVAVAGPSLLVPGFQVQDILSPLPDIRVPPGALLVDAEPEA